MTGLNDLSLGLLGKKHGVIDVTSTCCASGTQGVIASTADQFDLIAKNFDTQDFSEFISSLS